MARRKQFRKRRAGFSFARRSKHRSSENLAMLGMGAAVYGAAREKISNALTPMTSKVPLGTVADEVILGGLAYYGAKKVSNSFAKGLLKAAFVVEAARLGEAVADGTAFKTNGMTTQTSSLFSTVQ